MDITAYQHMNMRMSTRGKRPMRNLTPSDKVRAIQRIHNGETKASVSRDIGVPESTLRGWCKNEQKLRFMCRQLSTEQLPLGILEGPPEKRTKFDTLANANPKFGSLASFEDFAYNRLQLSSVSNNNNNINNNNNNNNANNNNANENSNNSIMENIALNEFIQKNKQIQAEAGKQFGSAQLQAMSSFPITGDYAQLPIMQNLNLLSLLNPSLAAISAGLSAGSNSSSSSNTLDGGGNKPKTPLRLTNAIAEETKDNAKNNSTNVLTVKDWAKDTTEQLVSFQNNNNNNDSKRDANDNNNNDIKNPLASLLPFPTEGSYPMPQFPAGLMQFPVLNENGVDTENSNAVLLEWCKVFNASLNFLALAAAAATLQPESGVPPTHDSPVYQQQMQIPSNFVKSSPSVNEIMQSDISNDSYSGSLPEDLSVRSTPNSRSQSPTKSTMSSFSMQSDAE